MKKLILALVAIFMLSVPAMRADIKEDLGNSQKRVEKIQKLCKKDPAECKVPSVNEFARKSFQTALGAAATAEKLENLYYRQIGQTKDGVTDVEIVKPTLSDWTELAAAIALEGEGVATATKMGEVAAQDIKNTKGLAAVAGAKVMKWSTDCLAVTSEEVAAQAKAVKEIIDTLKSNGNL